MITEKTKRKALMTDWAKKTITTNVKDGTLLRELIANHLYGPSYVSMSWALRWHGLIPERVHLIQSLTTKHSRKFTNSLGEFHMTSVFETMLSAYTLLCDTKELEIRSNDYFL